MCSDQQFCLQWHNYQSSLLAALPQLLDGDDLTDVTLAAGGRNLRAHKVVLSLCSQYFKDLFKMLQPAQHPVIVIPGANFADLCALVTFMYSGEVNIYQEQLPSLLLMANTMQIRGLAEVSGTDTSANDFFASKKVSEKSLPVQNKGPITSSLPPLLSHPVENMKVLSKSIAPELLLNYNTVIGTKKSVDHDLREGCNRKRHLTDKQKTAAESVKNGRLDINPETVSREINFVDNGFSSTSPISHSPLVKDDSPLVSRVKQEKDSADVEYIDAGCLNEEKLVVEDDGKPDDSSVSGSYATSEAIINSVQLNQGLTLTQASVPLSRQCVSCPVCSRVISQKRNLKQHLRTHQLDDENFSYILLNMNIM